MATIKNPTTLIGGSGGANVANGIIEQYKASTGTISANTFVEFVKNYRPEADDQLGNVNNLVSVVLLSSTKVFLLCEESNSLKGVVCTISGTTITVGTVTQIATIKTDSISCESFTSTKVFVMYGDNTNKNTYAMVCSISGTTITAGTEVTIKSSYNAFLTTYALSTTAVLCIYNNYAAVCTISGTTITVGTEKTMANYIPTCVRVKVLSGQYYACIYRYNTGVYCWILRILPGSIFSIEASKLLFSAGSVSVANTISVVRMDSSRFFLLYADANNYNVYGRICTFSDDSDAIEVGREFQYGADSTGRGIFGLLLTGTSVFVAHNSTSSPYTAYAMVGSVDVGGSIKTSETKIDGLTKTQCTTSTAGDVWVLDAQ